MYSARRPNVSVRLDDASEAQMIAYYRARPLAVHVGTELTLPLVRAVRKCYLELAEVLLEMGAKPGLSVIFAAESGHVPMIEMLFRRGASLDSTDIFGRTPINAAALYGHAPVIEVLVRLGSQAIDAPTFTGCTPLHTAAMEGNCSVIETLIRLGSKALDVLDRYGRSPLDRAVHWEKSEAVKALRALGAGDPLEDEDEAHEIRWRVYFRESFVQKLLRETK
jgi:ankyrin repeat protein